MKWKSQKYITDLTKAATQQTHSVAVLWTCLNRRKSYWTYLTNRKQSGIGAGRLWPPVEHQWGASQRLLQLRIRKNVACSSPSVLPVSNLLYLCNKGLPFRWVVKKSETDRYMCSLDVQGNQFRTGHQTSTACIWQCQISSIVWRAGNSITWQSL